MAYCRGLGSRAQGPKLENQELTTPLSQGMAAFLRIHQQKVKTAPTEACLCLSK